MSSLSHDGNGRWRIQFVPRDGKRRAIRLGKIAERAAQGIQGRVDKLVEAQFTGFALERDMADWVGGLDDRLAKKLAAVGLIAKREAAEALTLAEHLSNYFARRTDVKASTLTHWRQVERSLLKFFDGDRPLDSITAGDARDWERWLKAGGARKHRYAGTEVKDGLASNTVLPGCRQP
jgi:hypothetical protein